MAGMQKYVALLRGINVGGKNKVSMNDLKELLAENGFQDVVTYINSGNIIFASESTDQEFLQRKCQTLIAERFQLDLLVMVMAAAEFIEAISNAPEWWGVDPEAKHNALFVIPPETVEQVFAEVGEIRPEYERVGSYGRVIFWSAPLKTFSRTRWLTGYSQEELEAHLTKQTDFATFFGEAPQLNPARTLIKGVICGVRVEEIAEPLMREIRYLDKLIDELAKGKAMEKILRKS